MYINTVILSGQTSAFQYPCFPLIFVLMGKLYFKMDLIILLLSILSCVRFHHSLFLFQPV